MLNPNQPGVDERSKYRSIGVVGELGKTFWFDWGKVTWGLLPKASVVCIVFDVILVLHENNMTKWYTD